jgi:hypothetical protein|tara:strand:- start:920 stop:1066 length:147 start_codon:yes stop_codon:yes gene_type:complete
MWNYISTEVIPGTKYEILRIEYDVPPYEIEVFQTFEGDMIVVKIYKYE